MSELFTVNDCENAHNETQTKRFIGISNQMFYTRPSGHPQSMVNLDTMITCDWPPSHY